MLWNELEVKQPKVAKILENSIKANRQSHAYLFVGQKGVSKYETAILFAQYLYCENNSKPCGKCNNCLRIEKLTHGNVYNVETEGNTIKKEQITDLIHEFTRTSLEPGPKIYIIKDADKMSISAANSLLKFLEEPLNESYAILLTENISMILPTIISRSQVIYFKDTNQNEVYNYLVKNGVNNTEGSFISNMSNDINEALVMAKNEEVNYLIDLTEGFLNTLVDDSENSLIYFKDNSDLLISDKSKYLSNKFLNLILNVFTEFIKSKYTDTSIYFINFTKLKEKVNLLEINKLFDIIELIKNIEKELKYNVNVRLLMDKFIIQLVRSF